jgi:hypothetical protein
MRSRCARAGHCASTPASLSASCPSMPQRGSSSVLMCTGLPTPASCLKTNGSFAFSVPFRASAQKLLLKRTPAGRRILSTTSVTLFEILLSMIASRSDPAPVISRDDFQSCSKDVSGEQRWLRLRRLLRGTSSRRAACQYVEPLACLRPCRPAFSGMPRNVAYACWTQGVCRVQTPDTECTLGQVSLRSASSRTLILGAICNGFAKRI